MFIFMPMPMLMWMGQKFLVDLLALCYIASLILTLLAAVAIVIIIHPIKCWFNLQILLLRFLIELSNCFIHWFVELLQVLSLLRRFNSGGLLYFLKLILRLDWNRTSASHSCCCRCSQIWNCVLLFNWLLILICFLLILRLCFCGFHRILVTMLLIRSTLIWLCFLLLWGS